MKCERKIILEILVTFLVIGKVQTMRDFDILFNKLNCTTWSSDYIGEYKCNLFQLPRNRGNYLSGNIMFKKDITTMILDFRVILPSAGKTDNELLKFRLDGCQLAKFRNSNPILSSIVKKLRSAGNFPGKCPLKANVNYSVKNFALNPDYFPPFTPEMKFGAKMNVFMGKIHLLEAEIGASINKKN